jgi:hypothetical protein
MMPRFSLRFFPSLEALFYLKMLLQQLIRFAAQPRFRSWIGKLTGPTSFGRQPRGGGTAYQNWLEVNHWNERRAEALRQAWLEIGAPPRLSLIMSVGNPPAPYLEGALASVHAQIYPHWELCLVQDRDAAPEIARLIESWQSREPRLRVKRNRPKTGGSDAANTAAAMARYDYLLFMGQADQLAPDALAEVALGLARHPPPDVVYGDEDWIDAAGRRVNPNFKPDWSPELLLASMYLGPFWGLRRDLYHAVGGMRPGFGGSRGYDLALRVTERKWICSKPSG